MAAFVSSATDGIDMRALDFHPLDCASLNASDAGLSSDRITFARGNSGTSGYEYVYEGSFTYEHDGTGAAVAAQGEVTAYASGRWFDMDTLSPAWNEFSIAGFRLELSLFQALDGEELAKIIFVGHDVITGTAAADILYGFEGDDDISGGGGRDVIYGGKGADTMRGGAGDDTYYVGQAESVVELAGEGKDTVYSSLELTFVPQNVEKLVLLGDKAVYGVGSIHFPQAEVIVGNPGDNVISAWLGDDTLNGGAGNDKLRGGPGADLLRGGGGADTFSFETISWSSWRVPDTIADFAARDKVDFSRIDANDATFGNARFRFIGTAEFSDTSAAGQLRFAYDSASDMGMLLGSTDADAYAEVVVKLPGVRSLTVAELVL